MKFLLFILLTLNNGNAGHNIENAFCRSFLLRNAEIEFALKNSEILSQVNLVEYLKSIGNHGTGTSESYLVELSSGHFGVFKPEGSDLSGSKGEVAAYLLSEYLQLHVVPPTVIRTINGMTGSLQLFMKTDTDMKASKEVETTALSRVKLKDWQKVNLLHFLIGQWDRHIGNFLIDRNGHLIAIDNETMTNPVKWRLGEYPWQRRSHRTQLMSTEEFPFEPYKVIEGVSHEKMIAAFAGYLRPDIMARMSRELRNFPDGKYPYIIWRGNLWTQRRSKFGKFEIINLDPELRAKITSLTAPQLSQVLNDLVSAEKISEILERRDQILSPPPP